MKTIQLALLGMGLIFFNLKTLIFQSSFRITEELHRKYKEIWYIQFVHSPHLQIPFSLWSRSCIRVAHLLQLINYIWYIVSFNYGSLCVAQL